MLLIIMRNNPGGKPVGVNAIVRLTVYLLPVLAAIVMGAAHAGSVSLNPDRDATLIEHPHGQLANGAGSALFVGRTGQALNGVRRALLYFDIAGALPRNSVIDDVSIVLHLAPSNSAPATVSVHRVLDSWSEGPSSSSGGGGAAAQAGDVTWLHTSHDIAYWKRVGGHFVATASSATEVGSSNTYTWPGTPQLLADVRLWLHAPDRNFGWLLLGDEDTPQSAKRFVSREAPESEFRPVLNIRYSLPGTPSGTP